MVDFMYSQEGIGHLKMKIYNILTAHAALENQVLNTSVVIYGITMTSMVTPTESTLAITGENGKTASA